MTDLFYMGGPIFMGILTITLIALVAVAIISYLHVKNDRSHYISLVKEIGIFGFIFGLLGQTMGLYSAFSVIEQAGMVSPEILISGLKVSSITTMYGLIILVVGFLLYFGLLAVEVKQNQT